MTSQKPVRRVWLKPPLLILLATLALLLPGSWSLPLVDRDEPRFSRATVEMIDREEWVIPYLNDEYRFDKPPLTYWVMRMGYVLCGQNELGARLHTVVFSFLTAWVLFAFGKRIRDERVGLMAALMFLFSFQLVQHGRAAVADMPMVFAVTWCFFLVHRLLERANIKDVVGLIAALTIGFYAKGPIAWAVPLVALVLFRWVLWRKREAWGSLKLWLTIPAVLALLALWGIPALLQTKGAFWDIGMGKHVIERGAAPMNGRGSFIGFYALTAFLSLFPWSAEFGRFFSSLRQHWNRDRAFLLAWFLAPMLIFTFYATQLPHYILPGFGGFFLLLALAFHDGIASKAWHAIPRMFMIGLWIALIVLLVAVAFLVPLPTARYGILGFAGLGLGLLLAARRWWIPAALLMAVGTMIAGAGLRPLLPAVQLREQFTALPEAAELSMSDYFEPSVIFYSDRMWNKVSPETEAEAWMTREGPRMLILLEQEWKFDKLLKWTFQGRKGEPKSKDRRTRNAALQFGDAKTQFVEGMNPARSSWVKLRIVTRDIP